LNKIFLKVFLLGLLVIGPLDYYHTYMGVQKYLLTGYSLTSVNWPWFVAPSMGFASVILLVIWLFINRATKLPQPNTKINKKAALILSLASVCVGYLIPGIIQQWVFQSSLYIVATGASLALSLVLLGPKSALAFLTVAFIGPCFEWFALDPAVGYWQFSYPDLFGRVPAWELCVYGWGGVFIEQLSQE